MHPLISITGAGVTLGRQTIFTGLNVTLEPGETLGVVGPNGSGKTTLLRLLATLLTPSELTNGEVLGAQLRTSQVYRVRSEIGLLGHTPALIPELSIAENLDHACRLAAIAPSRVDTALRVVGLAGAAKRRVSACSHGMQRRTEIALLLLRKPRLLLLDEPKSGLDSEASALVDALVANVTEAGGGALIVSHQQSHLEGCSRIIRLPQGEVS